MFNLENAKKFQVVFEKSRESEESGSELTENLLNIIDKTSAYSSETRSIKSSLTSASIPQRKNLSRIRELAN